MKQVKSIGLFFAACIMAFAIGTLTGMEMTLQRQREIGKAEVLHEINPSSMSEKEEDESQGEKKVASFLDASALSGILSQDTELLVEEYDLNRDVSTINQEKLPAAYVGMNREEFLASMEKVNDAPPLSEREKGFVALEVESFSRERVVLVKYYRKEEPQEGYFLAFMDSKVIVLKEDKRTVYMTTDISGQMLPEDLRQEIMQLYYVENEKELFDFLESYSS